MKIKYLISILFSVYVFILTLSMSFFFYFNRTIHEEYSTSKDLLVGIGVIWILLSMILLTGYSGKKLIERK